MIVDFCKLWEAKMKGLSLRKKLALILLSAFLLLISLYTSLANFKNVKAAESDFIFSDGVITGYTGSSANIYIPDTINGQKVTTISGAFSFNDSITEVSIAEGITTINGGAFYMCSNLTILILPSTLTNIAPGTLSSCKNLSTITLSAENTSYVLENNILYSSDKTEIIQYVNKSSATSCVIPNSVTTIHDFAFAYSNNLTTISIPETVTSIADGAFSSCTSLASIIIDENNSNYTASSGILFSKDLTTLIAYPAYIPGTEYTVPSSVDTLSPYSFAGCQRMSKIIIGNSVTELTDAFDLCPSLTEIVVSVDNTQYSSSEGVLLSKDTTSLLYYPSGKAQTEYTTPTSVTTIGPSAFYLHSNLQTVNLTENVAFVDDYAFLSCSALTKLYVPNILTIFGTLSLDTSSDLSVWGYPDSTADIYSAFWNIPFIALGDASEWEYTDNGDGTCEITGYIGTKTEINIPSVLNNLLVKSMAYTTFTECNSLEYIYFYEGIVTIEASDSAGSTYIFDDCSSLREVYLPASLEKLQTYTAPYKPFKGCSALVNIFVDDNNTYFYDINGVLFSGIKTLIVYPNGKTAESYSIPTGTEGISYAAFENNYLKTVTVPGSVTTLSKGDEPTFKNNIDTVYLSSGIENVEDVFSETQAMSIFFPKSITTMSGFEYSPVLHTFYLYEESVPHTYAVAKDINYVLLYTVNFETYAGTALDSQVIPSGSKVSKPQNVTLKNHILLGWYTDAAFTNAYSFTNAVSSNMTLYAKWAEGYPIIYHLNGGKNSSSNPSYYLKGSEVILKDPTRTGYDFDGWYTNEACSLDKEITKITKDTTGTVEIWADWWAVQSSGSSASSGGAPLSDERKPEVYYTGFPAEVSYLKNEQKITITGEIEIKYAYVEEISVSYSGNIDKVYKYESGKNRLSNYDFSHSFTVDEITYATNEYYTISLRMTTGEFYQHSIPIYKYNLVTEVLNAPDSNIYMNSEKQYELRTMTVAADLFKIVGAEYTCLTPEICSISEKGIITPLAAGTAQIKTKITLDPSNKIEYVTEYTIHNKTTAEPTPLERELMCNCYGKYCSGLPDGGIDPLLIELIKELREKSEFPIYIVEGYRCPDYNWSLGGDPGSEHVYGTAADLWAPSNELDTLYALCDQLNANGGVGRYSNYIHIDVRGAYIRWEED